MSRGGMYSDWGDLESRARCAAKHGARHCFAAPEEFLHLLANYRAFDRVRRAVELHRKHTKEPRTADLALWGLILGPGYDDEV